MAVNICAEGASQIIFLDKTQPPRTLKYFHEENLKCAARLRKKQLLLVKNGKVLKKRHGLDRYKEVQISQDD